jgi:streptogramin lyase
MDPLLRRALLAAALVAIAGCSGGTGQSSLAPTGGINPQSRGNLMVPAGALLPVLRTAARRVGPTAYSTKKSLLFESDFSNDTINIYQTSALGSNPPPIATITEPSGGCPYDMTLDKKKNLYVVDDCLSQIEIYPKGSTTMSGTITDGITYPLGITIDKSQTLYVSVSGSTIQEYAKGSTSPTKTITGGGMSVPFGLSTDKNGNVYIADYGAVAVFELSAGGSTVTNLGLADLSEPLQTAVNQKAGYLWVTDGTGDNVKVYQLGGSTSPVQTIAGNGFPYSVSVENYGKPKGEAVYGDGGDDTVYAFMPGSYTPYATLTNGTGNPAGLLISKP